MLNTDNQTISEQPQQEPAQASSNARVIKSQDCIRGEVIGLNAAKRGANRMKASTIKFRELLDTLTLEGHWTGDNGDGKGYSNAAQLIADALEIVRPEEDRDITLADHLATSFAQIAEDDGANCK
jgi:hypothetical protein